MSAFEKAIETLAGQPLHTALAIGFVISVFCNVVSLQIIVRFTKELQRVAGLVETLVYRRRRSDD